MKLFFNQKLMTLIFIFLIPLISHSKVKCFNKIKVETNLLKTITFNNGELNLCDESSAEFKTFKALLFLENIGDIKYKKNIYIKGIIGQNVFSFFKKRVQKIVFNKGPECPGIAHTLPWERNDKILHICPQAKGISILELSSILIHEARHLDGPEYSHQVCRSGVNKGKMSCDRSYDDHGAYAVGTEYLLMLSKHMSLDKDVRKTARNMAIQSIISRFNQKVGDLQEGALLIDREGELKFFDGVNLSSINISIPSSFIPYLRGGIATFFDTQSKMVKEFNFNKKLERTFATDVLTDRLKKRMMALERAGLEVKDMLYSDQYVCFLLRNSIECSGRGLIFFRKEFTHFNGGRFIFTRERSSFLGAKQVYLVAESDEIYLLPSSSEKLRATESINWKKMESSLSNVGNLGFRKDEVILSKTGEVLLYDRRGKKWKKPLGKQRYKRLFAPFIWSKNLEKL